MSMVIAPPSPEAPVRPDHPPNGTPAPDDDLDLDDGATEPERLNLLDRTGIVAGRRLRRLADRHPRGSLWPLGLVVLAVLVGAVPRLVALDELPPGLHQDEAIYAYEAYSLAMTGRDHLGHPFNLVAFETFGDWAPPVLILLLAPVVALFGMSAEVVRGVTALIGLAGIPLVYGLGKTLTGRAAVGVIAAWLLALSPWHIHQTRWATVPSIAPTAIALGLLLLAWTLKHRSDRGLIWTAVAMSAALASYHTLRLYVPLVMLGTLPFFWRTAIRFKKSAIAIAGGIGLFVTGPAVWFTLRDPSGRGRLEQVSVFADPSIYLPPGTDIDAGFLIDQYFDYLSWDFLFLIGDGRLDSPPGGGVELRTAVPFLILGLLALVWTLVRRGAGWRRGMAGMLLAALIAAPIPAALTLPSPHVLRVVHAMPLLAVTAAIGVVAVWDAMRWAGRREQEHPRIRIDRRVGRAAQGVMLLGLLAAVIALPIELAGRYDAYFDGYRTEGGRNFQEGVEPAVRYALAHQAEYDQIWVEDMTQGYAFLLFYGEWDPIDVHERLVVLRDPPWFNGVLSFDKYTFREAPDATIAALPVLATFPIGGTLPPFEARGGINPEGQRVLVIRRSG